ncbi:MAG: hypothetical protein LBT95_04455 [Treponema sp.]|jgi:hypothetical protein|nr:hypothetical protein [Treponema sp.]
MSRIIFDEVSNKFWNLMKTDNLNGIMLYQPFSDQYWNERVKIVVCNYENVGYQDSQTNSLSFEHFRSWITYKKGRTVHYTTVFIHALLKLLSNEDYSLLEMKKSYSKVDDLHKSMQNITYMNIRPTSAARNRQEKGEVNRIIQKYKKELKAFIEALDADVFILSSKESVRLFNYIFDIKKNPLVFNKCKRIGNMIVFSVRHFGWFFRYSYYFKKAQEVVCIYYHKWT